MTIQEFEQLLDATSARLTGEARDIGFSSPKAFEDRVRDVVEALGGRLGVAVDRDPHPYAFPDIAIGEFGIEVKYTTNDTWRSVANSVFETFRSRTAIRVYVMFGKMGGQPEVRWARYGDCVIHVRTSHVPRFELDINASSSLFARMGIAYDEFAALPIEGKMGFIRRYARGRLKDGERLWWLEEKPEPEHSLPIQVRLYMDLPADEKRRLRAEATLLCPKIFAPSNTKHKYTDVALFLLTYHGVLVPQARDLFTAGSVGLRADPTRGGLYVARATADIADDLIDAAQRMEDALFVEYWGMSVPPDQRIAKWLELADGFAKGWVPSEMFFVTTTARTDPTNEN